MKKFALVLAGVLLGAPLALSAEASAAAEQIGRPASELVEMELLTSSEVVEKQKAGFINVIIANGGTGSTTKSGARTNLGIAVGTTAPAGPAVGDLWVDTN